MQGGLKVGIRKPATGGWRAGGRARDAREEGKRIVAVAQVTNALLYRLGNPGQQFLHWLQIADIRRDGSLKLIVEYQS